MRTLLPILLLACGSVETAELPVDQAAPPVFLTSDAFVLGNDTEVRVSGARPGGLIYLAYSFQGAGAGPCPTGLTGCIGILAPQVIATLTADANGEASLPLSLPNQLPASRVWMQAATLGPNGGPSNVISNAFLSRNGDEDGDGLTNGEEAQAGSNPFVVDSDNGGADDLVEVDVGTDPADAGDDVLHDITDVTVTLSIDLDFQGGLADVACIFQGFCDCVVTYQGSGVRSDAWDLSVEFDGTWQELSNSCTSGIAFDSVIWAPNNGQAYHTAEFSPGAAQLTAWGVSATPGPLSPVPDPIAARQGYLSGLNLDWDGSSPITFTIIEQTQPSGVDLETTVVGTVDFGF
jgi:hypothetical protein